MLKESLQKYKLNNIIREKQRNNLPIKLHIGCGSIYKDGWINIDGNSKNNIKKLDCIWDVRKDLPLDDCSVDFIYNEHFIEHLTYQEGQNFFKHMFRLLKKGAVMRIACPDLDYIIYGYINNNWREQPWVEQWNYQWIKSRCEMVNICLTYWGHRYVYNKEDLIRVLVESGFDNDNIYEVIFTESKYKDLKHLETRKDSMIFEARK
jgi:predicted SAM-dependent methyltransferase